MSSCRELMSFTSEVHSVLSEIQQLCNSPAYCQASSILQKAEVVQHHPQLRPTDWARASARKYAWIQHPGKAAGWGCYGQAYLM